MATKRFLHFPGLYREQLSTGETRFRIVISSNGKRIQRYFYFSNRDDESDALKRAKQAWAEIRATAPVLTRQRNAQIERRKSPTGIVGVRRVTTQTKGHDYDFWIAVFTDNRGQRRTKSFAVNRYGETDAKKRAVQARKDALAQLQ